MEPEAPRYCCMTNRPNRGNAGCELLPWEATVIWHTGRLFAARTYRALGVSFSEQLARGKISGTESDSWKRKWNARAQGASGPTGSARHGPGERNPTACRLQRSRRGDAQGTDCAASRRRGPRARCGRRVPSCHLVPASPGQPKSRQGRQAPRRAAVGSLTERRGASAHRSLCDGNSR